MKRSRQSILLQGATGSIGQSTLDVLREQHNSFELVGISSNKNMDGLLSIAKEFRPESIALEDATEELKLRRIASDFGIKKVFAGVGAATIQAQTIEYECLVNAMMGNAGVRPTLAALERGKKVALANKETLVAAGPLVLERATTFGGTLIPIDSEHSAILQCIVGERKNSIRKIWLTTSGGPFWGKTASELSEVTPDQALKHPTWKMGLKITIDSATLFNKGLEVIETARLFDLPESKIGIVRHRQSVVHSFVEFCDGSIKAQLGNPDMRLPILYALSYPNRIESTIADTDLPMLNRLDFEPCDSSLYPCLDLAFQSLRLDGTATTAISAADEVAVHAFLHGRIRFTEIAEVIFEVLHNWKSNPIHCIEIFEHADKLAREIAGESVRSRNPMVEELSCS